MGPIHAYLDGAPSSTSLAEQMDGRARLCAYRDYFSRRASTGTSFGYGVESLLAHETFHTWNPYRMGVLPDSSIGMSWFTEGFTTYYQDVLLLRAGLISFPEYVQHTNENLRKYLLSPARSVTNQEVIERHRKDSESDVIPYSRGATTALWLDSTIRKDTRGKSSLDTLMFDLVRQARRRKPALTAERVFRTAGKYIDGAALQQFREYAELGKTIPVQAALGPCATLQMNDVPRFELGIDREALISQHTVSGVKAGSAAFEAGLQDGQQVTRTNIYWNDVSKPVQLTVRTEGGSQVIEYYPRGPSLGLIPQYHLDAEASACPDQCVQ